MADKFRRAAKVVKMSDVKMEPTYLKKKLYEAVVAGNAHLVGQLFILPEFDKNSIYIYGSKRFSKKYNLFQILCSEMYKLKDDNPKKYRELRKAFINIGSILLDNGIDINYEDNRDGYKAIEFAVYTGELELVKMVTKIYEKNGVTYYTRPLFCRLLKIFTERETIERDYLKIMDYLAEKGVEINALDYATGEPAIYTAAKYKVKHAVTQFINKFYATIDLDYYLDANQKSARNFILKYHLYDGTLPTPTQSPYYILYKSILQDKPMEFIENYNTFDNLRNDLKFLLLFRALNRGSLECLEFLLQEIPPSEYNLTTILMISCMKGYFDLTEFLLQNNTIDYDLKLVRKIVKVNRNPVIQNETINHVKCLWEVLDNKSLDLNEKDVCGLTVMEYAIKYRNLDMITCLIKHGSSLIIFDGQNYTSVITQIDPLLVETYFDSCVTSTGNDKKFVKWFTKDKPVVFAYDYVIDYQSLLPQRKPFSDRRYAVPSITLNIAKLEEILEKNESLEDCETVTISKTELKHIHNMGPRGSNESGLNMKETEKLVPEMVMFRDIAENVNYRSLLTHPAVLIFVTMKWHQLRYYFYTYTVLNVVYVVILCTYLLTCMDPKYQDIANLFYGMVCLIFSIFVLLEGLHIILFKKGYFYFLERLWQLAVLILTAVVIGFHNYRHEYKSEVVQVHAAASFCSILNLFFIFGNFECFDISVILIKTTFFSIVKLVCFTYLMFFLAFAFCMYLLFQDNKSENYKNLGLSFFRTIVASLGYLGLESLELNRHPFSYVIMTFYIFLIPIALFNLVIGIAVSDIRSILISSQIWSQKVKVTTIDKVERIFFNQKIHYLNDIMKNIFLFTNLQYDRIVFVEIERNHAMVKGGIKPFVLPKATLENLQTVAKINNE